jgi:hypothetical protein
MHLKVSARKRFEEAGRRPAFQDQKHSTDILEEQRKYDEVKQFKLAESGIPKTAAADISAEVVVQF